jgi:hypothetical protein
MATCINYIFVDENNGQLISDVATRHGNSDHLLLECTLQNKKGPKRAGQWRFTEDCFRNELLRKEVLEELRDGKTVLDWDLCKINIQSIIRAFRHPKSQESRITQLNKKISALREQRAKKGANWQLDTQLEELKVRLGLETASLSEKWRLRSKAKWIEEGEKSTKYFFTRYKCRKTQDNADKIKIPTGSNAGKDVLKYIRDFYAEIYKKEGINREAAEKITASLPQVTDTMNNSLIREITQEEVKTVIQNLPRGKSPGTDGLTYEFYKATEEEATPVLTKLFNKVLEEGEMPSSWHKSLITIIPKKSEELESINNWRPISLVNSDAKIFMKIIADR